MIYRASSPHCTERKSRRGQVDIPVLKTVKLRFKKSIIHNTNSAQAEKPVIAETAPMYAN
jgi:hypothetical protein